MEISMMNQDEILKLQNVVNFIEENIRNSTKTDLSYVDLRNQKNRLLTKQNHVIFGRRGAGKSSLLNELKDGSMNNGVIIKLNMEDFKDIAFPNILTHILINVFEKFEFPPKKSKWYKLKKNKLFKKRRKELKKKVEQTIEELKELLEQPEKYTLTEMSQNNHQTNTKAKGELKGISQLNLAGERESINREKKESTRTYEKDKLLNLKDKISNYKEILNSYSNFYEIDHIFLVLDDFYFIPRAIQSKFIDYLHRLTKDTALFLKVASIKFRTKLYEEDKDTYVGMEINHDVMAIELDYTLGDFKSTALFMKDILNHINSKHDAQFINNLFAGEGFDQLCYASGGIPRDFLSLLTGLLNKIISNDIARIKKPDVTKMAIEQISNKIDSIKSENEEEFMSLEDTLYYIKYEIIENKKRNTFLVEKDEIETNPEEYNLIKQLMDLRLIHLVNLNVSDKNVGKRYNAYMVDIGLYPNSSPRNFKQTDLKKTDDKHRKDEIRMSPKLSLKKLKLKLRRYYII